MNKYSKIQMYAQALVHMGDIIYICRIDEEITNISNF